MKSIELVKEKIDCRTFLEKSAGVGMFCCPFCGSGRGQHRTGALRQCAQSDCSSCGMCPIFPDRECVEHLAAAAASRIERLTAENAALRKKQAEAEAERDALLEQIKARRSCLDCKHFDYCEFDNATVIECMNCVTKNCPCAGCCGSSRWEWRGLPEKPEVK